MTTHYNREDWPRVKPNFKSRIIVAWWQVGWYLRALWKFASGFVTGLVLGLALLHLIQARAEHEIILDFTTDPAITAPAPAGDSGLLLSYADRPEPGPEELRSWPS